MPTTLKALLIAITVLTVLAWLPFAPRRPLKLLPQMGVFRFATEEGRGLNIGLPLCLWRESAYGQHYWKVFVTRIVLYHRQQRLDATLQHSWRIL